MRGIEFRAALRRARHLECRGQILNLLLGRDAIGEQSLAAIQIAMRLRGRLARLLERRADLGLLEHRQQLAGFDASDLPRLG